MTGVLEFRPLTKQWESSSSNWKLQLSREQKTSILPAHMVMNESDSPRLLVDVHSPTFIMISGELGPLELPEYLTVTSKLSRIKVELPRFRLQFFVNSEQNLESHNLRGMVVDQKQSSGTMFGLRNQLILRTKDAEAAKLPQSRSVLIPHGEVHFTPDEDHVQVTISTVSKRNVTFSEYKVDADLGYLVNNVNLHSRLYKIYLHAVTSHCLPDPLTGRTGTEEALHELSLGATTSFQKLEAKDVALLQLIGNLTPIRTFHPPKLRNLEVVKWCQLSPLAQHYAFYAKTQSILKYAQTLQIFQESPDVKLDSYFMKRDETLLCRGARRTSVLYPDESIIGIPPMSGSGDRIYPMRDFCAEEDRTKTHAASWASELVVTRWGLETHVPLSLLERLRDWSRMSGPSDQVSLTFSPKWLKLDISDAWLSLYNLCRAARSDRKKFGMSFSLASMAYSSPDLREFVPVLLALATVREFANVRPPVWPSYEIFHGVKPTAERVKEIVTACARHWTDTPAAYIGGRRQRKERHCITTRTPIGDSLVSNLMNQWNQPAVRSSLFPQEAATWYNVGTILTRVEALFTSCRRNQELRRHLSQVDLVLQAADPSPGIIMTDPHPVISSDYPDVRAEGSSLGSIMLSKLLKGAAMCDIKSRPASSPSSDCRQAPNTVDTTSLETLLSEFQRDEGHPLRQRYSFDLDASRQELQRHGIPVRSGQLPPLRNLYRYRDICHDHKEEMYRKIQNSLAPSARPTDIRHPADQIVALAGLWPRITVRSVITQLALPYRKNLSTSWKAALIAFAQAFSEYQSSQRLVALASLGKSDEYFRELDARTSLEEEAYHNEDWLLIQVASMLLHDLPMLTLALRVD